MTPVNRDQLFKAIREGEILFKRLNYFTGRMKKGSLEEKEKEALQALVKEISLYEEQLLRKSYGEELLILGPLAKTLSSLANSLLLDRGTRALGFTLSIVFLETGEEGKGTELVGASIRRFAKELSSLFLPVFFPGITEGGKKLFENMALLYLSVSSSLGILALGVEREGALEEASEEVKKRVERAKEVALLYTSLFLQAALQQRFIELCLAEDELRKPYGSEIEGTIGKNVSGVLEFAFLGSFIKGCVAKDKRKGEYLFKALVQHLKERAAFFESFMKEALLLRQEMEVETLHAVAAAVTEMKLSVESEECSRFIESLEGLLESLGVDAKGFDQDLKEMDRLIQFLAFTISKEELNKIGAIHTGMVSV